MDIKSINLVCFSPTETTAKIVSGIAQGMCPDTVNRIDLTPPGAESQGADHVSDEWTIIGTPVYAGRVPRQALRRLRRIKANNAPAVVVVVYGNRDYEDALLELKTAAVELGFRPVAGGAFIGEHSYTSVSMPIAAGRPDDRDMEKAKRFGASIKEKISRYGALDGVPALHVPGNYPYIEWPQPPEMAPVTDASKCTLCAECADLCPTAAIRVDDAVLTQNNRCIHCCACIKKCPAGARQWENAWIEQVRTWLSENCRQRKEPDLFL